MAAKHTPGPWTVIGGTVFGNGLRAARPMNAADAALMAAAPELLAALRAATEQINLALGTGASRDVLKMVANEAEQVIARAEGRA